MTRHPTRRRTRSTKVVLDGVPEPVLADRPMTPKQLARFLQVSLRTVQRHVRRRDIPFVKIGARVRFVPSDVLARLRGSKP